MKHLNLLPLLIALLLITWVADASAGDGTKAMSVIPGHVVVLFSADMDKVEKLPIAKDLLAAMPADAKKGIEKLKQATGFDAYRDLSTVAFGAPDSFGEKEDFIIVAEGKFSWPKIKAFALKEGSVTARTYRGVSYVADDDGGFAYLRGMIVAASTDLLKQSIDLSKGKGKNAAATHGRLMKSFNTSGHGWMLVDIKGKLAEEMSGNLPGMSKGKPIKSIYGSVDLSRGLKLLWGANTATSTDAAALATLVDLGKKELANEEMVKGLKLVTAVQEATAVAKGSVVTGRFFLSDADVNRLMKMVTN